MVPLNGILSILSCFWLEFPDNNPKITVIFVLSSPFAGSRLRSGADDGDLRDVVHNGRGGQRGHGGRHRAQPLHAHRHQLLPLQPRTLRPRHSPPR